MYSVVVIRQTSPIAVYGPFADIGIANEFIRVYLNHESNARVAPNYGTFSEFANRDEMKFV